MQDEPPRPSPLIGPHTRILVVEDSFLVARSIARIIRDLGAEVIGPAATVEDAIRLVEGAGCDAAVLDINLNGLSVEPVAERLVKLGVPFVFLSGYASPGELAGRFVDHRILHKPVDARVLQAEVRRAFGRHGRDSSRPGEPRLSRDPDDPHEPENPHPPSPGSSPASSPRPSRPG